MKKLAFLFSILFAQYASAQSFEGIVVYSKTSTLPNAGKLEMQSTYFYKKNAYKSETFDKKNPSKKMISLYSTAAAKLYNYNAGSSSAVWIDVTKTKDPVVEVKELPGKTETILGETCKAILVKTKKNEAVYYYSENPEYAIDPDYFEEHLYGAWYDYLAVARALPLKVVQKGETNFEMTATKIELKYLDNSEFKFPVFKETKGE